MTNHKITTAITLNLNVDLDELECVALEELFGYHPDDIAKGFNAVVRDGRLTGAGVTRLKNRLQSPIREALKEVRESRKRLAEVTK